MYNYDGSIPLAPSPSSSVNLRPHRPHRPRPVQMRTMRTVRTQKNGPARSSERTREQKGSENENDDFEAEI